MGLVVVGALAVPARGQGGLDTRDTWHLGIEGCAQKVYAQSLQLNNPGSIVGAPSRLRQVGVAGLSVPYGRALHSILFF